jgi:pimeloyl-ACP methyl ester carboxylesterase
MLKMIDIAGLRLAYREVNPEKDFTVIFVHGNSQSSNTFEKQLAALTDARLLALDFPGHGASEKASAYSIPVLVRSLVEFIESTCQGKYILCGHSLGGHIVLQSLNQLSPVGVMISGTPPLSKPMNADAFRAHPLFGLLYQGAVTEEEVLPLLCDLYLEPEQRACGLSDFLKTDPAFRPALLSSILAGELVDEILVWENFKGPKLITGGTDDRVVNYDYVKSVFPELDLISGNHNIQLEQSEAYNLKLNKFIRDGLNPTNIIPIRKEFSLHV